jgi:hypothetical protein
MAEYPPRIVMYGKRGNGFSPLQLDPATGDLLVTGVAGPAPVPPVPPTTITVGPAQVGTVLASNGTLTAVRMTTPPNEHLGVFKLVDQYLPEAAPGWPCPRPEQPCRL